MQPLNPAIKIVWRIKAALFWGACIMAGILADIMSLIDPNHQMPFGIVPTCILLLGTAWTFFIPALRYRFWCFDLRSEELYLERGIWNRVRTIVPLRRIQHLDVSQDILERNYDLGRLIVHTAGAHSGDVVVPGLRYEEAERLRDHVKNYITEDAV